VSSAPLASSPGKPTPSPPIKKPRVFLTEKHGAVERGHDSFHLD